MMGNLIYKDLQGNGNLYYNWLGLNPFLCTVFKHGSDLMVNWVQDLNYTATYYFSNYNIKSSLFPSCNALGNTEKKNRQPKFSSLSAGSKAHNSLFVRHLNSGLICRGVEQLHYFSGCQYP